MNRLINVFVLLIFYLGAFFGAAALMLLGENESIGLYGLPIIVLVILAKNAYTKYFPSFANEMGMPFHKFNNHIYLLMFILGCIVIVNYLNGPKYDFTPSFSQADIFDRDRIRELYLAQQQKLKTLKIISAIILISPYIYFKLKKI
jgi:hypothetical protein